MSRHFWRCPRLFTRINIEGVLSSTHALLGDTLSRSARGSSSPFPKTIPLQRTLGVSSAATVTGDLVFVEITDASII
jgi:hypothetical protein